MLASAVVVMANRIKPNPGGLVVFVGPTFGFVCICLRAPVTFALWHTRSTALHIAAPGLPDERLATPEPAPTTTKHHSEIGGEGRKEGRGKRERASHLHSLSHTLCFCRSCFWKERLGDRTLSPRIPALRGKERREPQEAMAVHSTFFCCQTN